MRRSKVEGHRVVLRIVRGPRGRRHEARLDDRDARVVFVGELQVGLELRGGRARRFERAFVVGGALDGVPEMQTLGDVLRLVLAGGAEDAFRGRAGDEARHLVSERSGALRVGRAGVELERERPGEGARLGLFLNLRQVDGVAEPAARRLEGVARRGDGGY